MAQFHYHNKKESEPYVNKILKLLKKGLYEWRI